MNSNFMVKVEDAKLPDVQKALKAAGIKVRSIIEIFKEELGTSDVQKEEQTQGKS
ncbi:MAG: hypothetical protein JSV13_09210 [Nitrospiraceae bacterium]|nr:MAG: hypothetical protein JSV13_09210 [Nitrospiraceae bacterium]